MSIFRNFIFILSITYSFPLIAEPLFVQSGEHDGFTRLVTKLSIENGWTVTQNKRTITLQISGHSGGFDTSRVFNLIPRDRVQRVDAGESTLTIYLGCDCSISTFGVNGEHVALDVKSPPKKTVGLDAKKRRPPQIPTQVKPDLKQRPPQKGREGAQERKVVTSEELAMMDDLQKHLSQELGRAITRGVLNPGQPPSPPQREQITLKTLRKEALAVSVRKPEASPASNIRISTSMDVPNFSDPSQFTLSDHGLTCPPDDFTDVANWGDARAFDVQISETRLKLFGEFDRVNSAAAIALAKQYIYFGFGAEARQVLELNSDISEEFQLLLNLADILDAPNSTAGLFIRDYENCNTSIALWAFLSHSGNVENTQVSPRALLLTLSKLPAHLRQYLAPFISERFLQLGDTFNAATTLRSLGRLPESEFPAEQIARANIQINTENTVAGAKSLYDVVQANAPQSPEALINFVNAKVNANQPIDLNTINLIESYEKELGETEIGPNLSHAHILALIEMQEFDLAQLKIFDLRETVTLDRAIELQNRLVQKLVKRANDIDFLDIILGNIDRTLPNLNDDVKILLGNRLQGLGFPVFAGSVIKSISEETPNVKKQILEAQIELALGQPFQAQASLLGITHEFANILRADAKSLTGDHADAHGLYRTASQSNAAIRSAWLAENWRELVPNDDPVFGAIRAVGDAAYEPIPNQIGMLGRSIRTVEEAGRARQTMIEFLSTVEY